ncbi:hypothetical protein CASFOL_000301 [Castilleja foliolosa]|uniref:RRM domain-containing protein n=1 Tax=Castilleja foliolosa TaxID=1961234 RepID=A0ABD3ENA8_9LAMI
MNSRGFAPSSFFSEEVCLSDETLQRPAGVRKVDHMTGYSGLKSDGTLRADGFPSSPHEQMAMGFVHPNYYLNHGRNANHPSGKHIVGSERAASHSLPCAVDHDLGSRTNLNNMDPASYFFDGDEINPMGARYENGLFSSSMSDLFSRKLKLSSNDAAYSHSVAAAAVHTHYEEDEAFESLAELEAQTIGNLLPDDDDLFSGVTDGFDSIMRPHNGEDMEDLDLFSSVGGLELGEDGYSLRNSELSDLISPNKNGGEHPFGEHPSRTLFVRNINSTVEDSELQTLFEQFGDIRTLYTACKHRGFVMISYYDIRASRNAMRELQNKPLRRRKLDIHFSIPKENPSDKDVNQGTLVVFNLDSSVSNDELREIFGVYGDVKEIREAPHMAHHKFIEFYDIRAAESALRALNRSDIAGKQIKLEPGRLGGSKRLMQPFSSELKQEESGLLLQQHSSPSNNMATGFSVFGGTAPSKDNGTILGPLSTNGGQFMDNVLHPGVSSSVPNNLPSLVRVESGNQSSFTESSLLRNHLKFELQGTTNLHPHSLPEHHDGLSSGPPFGSPSNMTATIGTRPPERIDSQQFHRVGSNGQSLELNEVFGSSGNGSCPPPRRHYMWNNPHHPRPQPNMWPSSPSFVNGVGAAAAHPQVPQQLHGVPRAPSHMMNSLIPLNNHHVGSAPSVDHSLWDRRQLAYAGESPDAATVFHPGSLGNMRISGNSPHPLDFVPHNIFPRAGGNCMDVPISSKSFGLHHPHHQRCMIFPSRGQMLPMMSSFDSPNERTRNRRNEGNSSQGDNKRQFELDLDRIARGDDKRTTLMIKNIPNKYTSKMLLTAIDERHRGTYDFIYLPIDFKNKCNVGYAFINMTEPSLIVPFYQTFNGKKWEKFNSEKVASLAYARIQGKDALVAHFQNSSLMNEDKRCRPILFHTDGPNAGDQVPFPMGPNIRPRPGKTRTSISGESNQEIPSHSLTGEDYFNGDSSSGSGKDSD